MSQESTLEGFVEANKETLLNNPRLVGLLFGAVVTLSSAASAVASNGTVTTGP